MYRAGRQVQCACDSCIVIWCSALRISSGLACGGYGLVVGSVVLRVQSSINTQRTTPYDDPTITHTLYLPTCSVHIELLMDAFDIRNMQSLLRCNKIPAELRHAGFIYYKLTGFVQIFNAAYLAMSKRVTPCEKNTLHAEITAHLSFPIFHNA